MDLCFNEIVELGRRVQMRGEEQGLILDMLF